MMRVCRPIQAQLGRDPDNIRVLRRIVRGRETAAFDVFGSKGLLSLARAGFGGPLSDRLNFVLLACLLRCLCAAQAKRVYWIRAMTRYVH